MSKSKVSNYAMQMRQLRKDKGLSQSELARKFGMTTGQFISNVERGLCRYSTKHYRVLCKVFKVSKIDLIKMHLDDYKMEFSKKAGVKL